MPELSRFFGIVIRLHYADHNPPHFHATYQGRTVEVDIRSLAIIEGGIATRARSDLPRRTRAPLLRLAEDWRRASSGEPIVRIAPLA
jgi:hypothetical protein